MVNRFSVGDRVVYVRDKVSERPGKRAKNVFPAPHGETYTYEVEKYWLVDQILNEDQVVVRTRRGKLHTIPTSDPRLRKARWWEKFFLASRFPSLEESAKPSPAGQDSNGIAGAS